MSNQKITFRFTVEQIISEGRVTQDDIDITRRWSTNEKIPELTDEQIILFLLSCDNKQEATKNTIKAFYQIKKCSPFLFDNRNIDREDFRKYIQLGQFCVLPERTDDGCLIVYYRLYNTLYYDFDIGRTFAILLMSLDASLQEYPWKGLILLCDMKGLSFMHLTRVNLRYTRTIFQYLQEALPVKLKNIHILNSGSLVDKLMLLMKPFVKKELLDLVHFSTWSANMEEFYDKFIPRKCLPQEYGGNLGSVEELHLKNIEKLKDLQSHFDAEELQRHNVNT